MRTVWNWTWRYVALVVAYIVLFAVGSRFLGPDLSELHAPPVNPAMALAALFVIALVDVAILLAVVRTSRLSGWPLVLLLALLIYAVKTFTSGIEAWYFMTNVTPVMIPGLFAMTLPLVVLLPPLAVSLCAMQRGNCRRAVPSISVSASPSSARSSTRRCSSPSAISSPGSRRRCAPSTAIRALRPSSSRWRSSSRTP